MKAKTKKIVAKRFNVSKHGLLLRRRQNSRHLKAHKSKGQLGRYKQNTRVNQSFVNAIRSFLPYA